MYIGDVNITQLYLGDNDPSAAYIGDLLIYPSLPFSGFDMTSSIEFPKSGGTMQIRIKSHTTWEIGTAANWLSFSQTTGSGNTYVTVTATDNDTEASRNATITGQTLDEVYSDQCDVEQVYRIPYETYYFTIRSLADNNTISLPRDAGYSASTDNGTTWVAVNNSYRQVTLDSGDTILFKHIDNNSYQGGRKFTASAYYEVYGNLASLMVGDSFSSVTSASTLEKNSPFKQMFSGDTKVVNAEGLVLPWGQLGIKVQSSSKQFFYAMFKGCTSLTSAPELPATTLANAGYHYQEMFYGCTSLTKAPSVLPALSCPTNTYLDMFKGCTSLTKAPEISATALTGSEVFRGTFSGCINLSTPPSILPATALTDLCYSWMFEHCSGLTETPLLPAVTVGYRSYDSMFDQCRSLTKVTCLATGGLSSLNLSNWMRNVSSSGTFYKASGVTWPTGNSGIPSNWTVVDYSE